jgi:SAM-dependent methyltransferase
MTQDSSRPTFWDTRYRDGVTPWDSGGVPADLRRFAETLPQKGRVLIPGCGSGYEALYLAERGFDVLAIDFSPAAVELAQKHLGRLTATISAADFFEFDAGQKRIDVVYERAFLCALPRKMWSRYAARVAELLQPGTLLAGFFLYGDKPRGPPFGTTPTELHGLLDGAFDLSEDQPASESLLVFEGGERWQIWRRRGKNPPCARP